MSHNFQQLKESILALSNSKDFDIAKKEWKWVGLEVHENWTNCLCGKDIKEQCYLKNTVNGNETYVGNVCINKFIGIDTGNIFAGLKRIISDDTANANEDLIYYAYKFGYIFEKEYGFLSQTKRKRRLSSKQISWKQKINRRIINQTVVKRGT